MKKLQVFADANQVTTGKFTIGDEKVRHYLLYMSWSELMEDVQQHNAFMRVEVSPAIVTGHEQQLTEAGPGDTKGHGPDGPGRGDGEAEGDEEQLQVRHLALGHARTPVTMSS